MSLWSLMTLVHLGGLALALGAAAVKVALLVGVRSREELAVFLRVVRPITLLIVTGMILLTGSGIAWLALGRPFTTAVVAKTALAAGVWGIGPVIDKVAEPRLRRLTAADGTEPGELARARRLYFALELGATGLLVAVTVLGVLA